MAHPVVDKIEILFQAKADIKHAIPMRKYMKLHFEFYGIKSPLRRTLTAPFLRANQLPQGHDLRQVLQDLWDHPKREMQYVALDMMQKAIKKVKADFIHQLEIFIITKSWWDSVDGLAVTAGEHFGRYPDLIPKITNTWISSDHMWLQRSAILFQLRYKEKTDWPLLERYIISVYHNPEFFIQKACGWALRQYSKTNPRAVSNFVNKHSLSSVCRREAVKYI